ncbi:MAG TPA: flagellar protein FlgN, partial [Cupriavidus sp.]|nr:flagellar protein FlgN [Cupriavidus sp.]
IEAGAIAAFGRALADEREAIKRQDFQALTDLLGKKMELAQADRKST